MMMIVLLISILSSNLYLHRPLNTPKDGGGGSDGDSGDRVVMFRRFP